MKKILSIDGGGIRGIIPALVLAGIEETTGRHIAETFDLIAGTSTGGIIALGLCVPFMEDRKDPCYTASDMACMYRQRGRDIFWRSFWKGVSSVGGLADEKYDHGMLQKILDDFFGEKILSEALTNVFVSAYDIHDRKPIFLKSWRSETGPVLMSAAARATSAAPTYFEPALVRMGDDQETFPLIDGGVCVNNPALCAYAEAIRLWPEEHEFVMVSLGTGENTRPIGFKDAQSWGLVEWARPVLSIIMDGMSDAVDYQLRHILGGNYYRFQCRLDTASDDMDNASAANILALKEEAANLIGANADQIMKLCSLLHPE